MKHFCICFFSVLFLCLSFMIYSFRRLLSSLITGYKVMQKKVRKEMFLRFTSTDLQMTFNYFPIYFHLEMVTFFTVQRPLWIISEIAIFPIKKRHVFTVRRSLCKCGLFQTRPFLFLLIVIGTAILRLTNTGRKWIIEVWLVALFDVAVSRLDIKNDLCNFETAYLF